MEDRTTVVSEETDKYKFLQLLLLRCLHENTSDFRIVYHDDSSFHLILEDDEDTSIIDFCFSLDTNCVQEDDFTDEGEFSLSRCFKIINLYKTARTKTNYFIFTNRPTVKLKFFTPHISKYSFLSFNSLYNVNLDDNAPNILIDQVPSSLNLSINECFQTFTSQYPINRLNSQLILERFYNYIRHNLIHNLTKQDIKLSLLDLFISRYKVDLSYSNQCDFHDLWSDIICDKLVVIVKSDYVTDTFLRTHTASAVAKFGDPSDLAYKNLWFQNKVSLLIHAQSPCDLSDILNVLKMFDTTLRVTILSNFAADSGTICNLNDNQIKALQNCKINLQGKFNTDLGEFMEESLLQSVGYDDIIRLVTNNFIVDYCYKKLPSYYIERFFFKTILRFDILKDLHEEVFVVKNKTDPNNFILKSLENYHLSNVFIVEDCEMEVIENAKSRNVPVHFVIFYGEDWLEWMNSWGSLENLQKYNISQEVRITCSVPDLIKCKHNINVLVMDKLMGKSILLDCIALQIQDEWVITLQLDQYLCYYKSHTDKSPLDCLQHFYNREDDSELSKKLLERFISMKKIHILLDGFDLVPSSCLHEVIEIITSLHKEGLNIWLIVSSENVSQFEKCLNTISTIVKPFNNRDQKNLLIRYLKELLGSNESVNEFVEALLTVIRKELDVFLKFPLYLKFIGNIFFEELKHSSFTGVLRIKDNFDLLHFMELFMVEKVNWLVERYDESIRKFFTKQYPLLALQSVFDKNDLRYLEINKKIENVEMLVKEGILTEDGLEASFPQPIIADYLSAKWLFENLRNSNKVIRGVSAVLNKRRFFDLDRYKGVFKMFDYMLVNSHPLHTALIQGKFNQIESILTSQPDCFSETDAGGRNIVHIAALYGVFHPKIQNNPSIDMDDNMVKIILLADLKAIEAEDTLLGCSALDYALGSGCLAVANAICEKAPHLISNIYLAPPLLETYYEYCMRVQRYKPLYKNLLKYTICLKVATKEYRQNTRVDAMAEKLNFNEMNEENFRSYLNTFNNIVLSHLLETLQLKKEDSKYFKNLQLASAFGDKENIIELLKEGAKINNLRNYSYTPLHIAIAHENLGNMKYLLSVGAKINIVDVFGNTGLHLACQYSNPVVVKKLIKKGADISIQNDEGDTPFHHALKHSKEQNAELFLPDKHYELFLSPETSISCDRCIDINLQNKNGDTPLLLALQNDCLYIARELLEYHADVNIENQTKNTCLHYAVRTGNYKIVLELIYSCVDINAVNEDGETPLLIALKNRFTLIAHLLITKGAKVTDANNRGLSCLHYAALTGLNRLVEILLDNGADINKPNNEGETTIAKALSENRPNTARYLLNKGADVHLLDKNSNSLLHHTAFWGLLIFTKDLLAVGCDFNVRNFDGDTPLMAAIRSEKVIVAKLLISHGADVTVDDKDGSSCLHLSVRIPSLDLIKKLLTMGLDINQANNEGNTPLILATQLYHNEIVKFLIANGADITMENRSGYSCIHFAAEESLEDIISELVSKGADLNKETLRGDTPLFLHIKNGYSQSNTTKLLVENGADVTKIESRSENSCLHLAANTVDSVIVEVLLTTGININLQNTAGDTPLHLAVKRGHWGITELLLAKGADVTIRDRNGNTCLHSGVTSGQEDIVKALIRDGADVNATNNDGESIMSRAERSGDLNIVKILMKTNSTTSSYSLLFSAVKSDELYTVKMLLKDGSDINMQDAEGNTPILLALQNNYTGIVDFLLSQGADITIPNRNGTTCLHNAGYRGDFQITRQLLEKGAQIDVINTDGETPLQLAITYRYIHTAQLLLDYNAKIDLIPSSNVRGSCLHCACEEGADEIVAQILQSGFYIDKLHANGGNALIEALARRREHVAINLIEHCADLELENESGWSPLFFACSNQYLDVVNLLLNKGVNVNKSTSIWTTPLFDAIANEKRATAMLLITQGADVNWPKYWGNSVLHTAASSGMDDVVMAILDQGFDIDKINDNGHTALYNAINNNNFSTAQLLISKGADLDTSYWNFSSYLHIAIESGYEDLIIKYINGGANIHHDNPDSSIPLLIAMNRSHVNIVKLLFAAIIAEGYEDDDFHYLHHAAQFGDNKIITSLLNLGYDINKQDNDGETPLLVALRNENYQSAKLLLSKGADYFNIQVEGRHAYLHSFAQIGWNDLLLKIIKEGVDVNSRSYNQETALHIATRAKNISTIKLLLSNGADLSLCSYYDRTALYYAIEADCKPAIEVLLENIDVNKFRKEIKSAIFCSLDYQYPELTEMLLKYCIDDLKRESGESMLELCVNKQYHGLVLELLQKFGNVNQKNSDGDTPLVLALVNEDEQMIKLLLEHDADLQVINKKGNSCLHYAVRNSEEILLLLLKQGANLDLKNNDGLTPLLYALEETYTASAQLLIAHGANVHIEDVNGNNCLHYAAKIGAEDLVKYLTENGFDINKKNSEGDDCLDLAINRGYINIIKLLIDKGMDVHRTNRFGETCLLKAVEENNDDFVKELLEMGVDVNVQCNRGYTPFIMALSNSSTNYAQMLLARNADVRLRNKGGSNLHYAISQKVDIVEQLLNLGLGLNEQDTAGDTPLLLALQSASIDFVELLLKKGANIHIRNNEGNSCLHYAIEAGEENILTDLLTRGPDVNKRNIYGETPLLKVLKEEKLPFAKILVKYGADIDVHDNEGNSCLFYAAKFGFNELVTDFISKDVNINYENGDGVSPFLAALENKQASTVKLLIENGADIYCRSAYRMTWLSFITCDEENSNDNVEILDLLLAKGIDIDTRSSRYQTPLLSALKNQYRAMVDFLITKGADIFLTCYDSGCSCLHYAALAGYDDLAADFLDKGLDIDRENNSRETPVRLAFNNRHSSTIELLLSRGASVDDGNFLNTYMHQAVEIGDKSIILQLINKGADLNRINDSRKSPLMIAVENKNTIIAKLLYENGANCELPDLNFSFNVESINETLEEPDA